MQKDFQQQVIEEFRAGGGRVGGWFEGARLLLLTTVGARTGLPHTTPLGYLPDGGERVLVIASAGGAPGNPDWFHNLVAEPRVTVEDGVFTYEAEAVVLVGAERDEMFARAVEADPGWAGYQAKTSRRIPVVALRQVAGGPPQADSPGAALKLVHDAFRRELALIMKEIAEPGPGQGPGAGAGLGAQLRVNCLTLCQGLHFHHTAEDTGMLPGLLGQRPELAGVVDRLVEEHRRVAVLLEELQRLVTAVDVDRDRVLAGVERLVRVLEEHLRYEEEQLIPVLGSWAP